MTERPNIADKVRFWEEQDRINKELIPRVLKIHELVTSHVSGHQDTITQIGVTEARLVASINRTRMQVMVVGGVSLVVAIAGVVLAVLL